ncbi:MAG: ERCC4 domain-containing protein [archaeon]
MKKQIENIFSKTKTSAIETKCPNLKIPIIIDTREKQSLITANLVEKKANIEFEQLEIGDYLIQNTIIERKTFSDFVSSMLNKRLIEQLINLKKYSKHFLIIEGFYYNYNKFNVHENAIRGMLLSIAIDFQVPIIFTEDEQDTASFLILTAKKYEKPKSLDAIRPSKTFKTLEEQKQFVLEGFRGVGPTTAKQLLEKFKTLKEIFNIQKEQLKKISRFDENKIKKFLTLLNN